MNNVGLKKGYLEIMNYRDDYPQIYEEEKNELQKIYQNKIYSIDHVGSTSIKGIKSKPIIDILIQTDDLDDFKKYTESNVEGEIYTVKKEPTMGGDYLVRKEEDGKVKAFIHVYKTGDIRGITSIMFRDYMNNHEEERKKYEYIKEVINKAIKEENMENKICQSCGMPMKETDYSTNKDGSINRDYCKYCYKDGEFIDNVTMEEYIDMCSKYSEQAGMTNEEMKEYLTKLFPTLKRWRDNG